MKYQDRKESKRRRNQQKIRARNRIQRWKKMLISSLRKINALQYKAKIASDMIEKHREHYLDLRYRSGLPPGHF